MPPCWRACCCAASNPSTSCRRPGRRRASVQQHRALALTRTARWRHRARSLRRDLLRRRCREQCRHAPRGIDRTTDGRSRRRLSRARRPGREPRMGSPRICPAARSARHAAGLAGGQVFRQLDGNGRIGRRAQPIGPAMPEVSWSQNRTVRPTPRAALCAASYRRHR